MADVTLDTAALDQLNQDQKKLLDTIDSLRRIGVDKFVPLPQLIVVGDQSSGKSSVLEAISRVRFPTKGGLCTRFATELVLRTAPRVKIDVKITRDQSTKQSTPTTNSLQSFSETLFSKDALPGIIEEAKRVMGVRDGPNSFSEDVLHVEISGPDLPELTLVDLPGFYEAGSAEQSEEGRTVVARLADRYMSQSNSIILAVVSAKAGLNAHKVLRKAKEHDPNRERTLGIITKPDRTEPGSDDETKYIQTIRNKEPKHTLKLGWHVLRNRGEMENTISDTERDTKETEFLQSGRWGSISSKDKGIEALRKKLSKVLVSHIQARLPDLIEEIGKIRAERHDRLMQLGRPRSTPDDLRIHLSGLASQYEKLAIDAIEGTYRDPFFPGIYAGSSTFDDSDIRRLRATIRNMNRVFDALMSHKGSAESIVMDKEGKALLSSDLSLPEYLTSMADMYQVDEPKAVTLSELKAKLEVAAAKTQGSEFPGSSNDNLALDLFKDQSKRWESIAKRHIDLLVEVCRSFVDSLLDHIAGGDPHTRNAIAMDRVSPFFDQCSSALEAKLQELLHHYKHGPAMPLEAEFLEKLGSKTKTRLASQVKDLLKPMLSQAQGEDIEDDMIDDAVRSAPETDVTKFGVERVIDIMAVYYEMSLRTFVENVIILAVENCLVQKIPKIFTTQDVAGMEASKLKALAAESPDIQEERDELNRGLKVLNEGLEKCKIYKPRGSMGFRQSVMSSISRDTEATPEPLRSSTAASSGVNLSNSISALSLSSGSESPLSDPKSKRIATESNGVTSTKPLSDPLPSLGSSHATTSNGLGTSSPNGLVSSGKSPASTLTSDQNACGGSPFVKAPSNGTFGSSGGLFGAATPVSAGGALSTTGVSPPANSNNGGRGLFGLPAPPNSETSQANTTRPAPSFGTLFPPSTTGGFGQSTASSTPSLFGAAASSTLSVSGQPPATTGSLFGARAPSTPSASGQPPATTGGLFGGRAPSTPSAFGQGTSSTAGFGNTKSSSATSLFGQPAATTTSKPGGSLSSSR